MPDLRSVSNNRSWSSTGGNNTSQRVKTGSANRPQAEYKLKNSNISIRTGARVRRARGAWVGFKRAMTAIVGKHFLSAEKQTQRRLRHAEYQFDRHTNRLVEDLANNPNLNPKDVSKRLNQIAEQAEKICKLDSSVNQKALSDRFMKNLDDSLQALAQASPQGLSQVVNAFQQGGALHDIKNEFTFHSDKNKDLLIAQNKHQQSKETIYHKPPMMAADYVNAEIVTPENKERHDFGQQLIGKIQNLPALAQTANEKAQSTKINDSLKNKRPFQGTINSDFTKDSKLRLQLDKMHDASTQNVSGQVLSDQFLKDIDRATMKLTDANGNTSNIRERLSQANLAGGDAQGQEIARNSLVNLTDSMGLNGDEQATAIKHLSRLMNQEIQGSLHVISSLSIDANYSQLSLLSGKEDVTHDASIDKNGDLLITAGKKSSIEYFSGGGYKKMHKLDSSKPNQATESITIRVKREDLVKEPLKYEIVSAKTQYQLNTYDAKSTSA